MAPPTHSDVDSQLIQDLENLSLANRKLVKSSDVDSQLIQDLENLSLVNRKLVKSTAYAAPADPSTTVKSWKMNEFKYYQVPSPFPTLARGLFSVASNQGAESANTSASHRIVARGYDKFFNIGEVPWTTWPSLEAHTAPPYVLSLKSNGCIIFIAALTPSKLLITSKHAIGAAGKADDAPLSHAEAGEQWLRKYLAEKGKKEGELAQVLWQNNWTAIAELCDDSFEEHVLSYASEKTGLHLHGINECTKAFNTLPQAEVDAFAEKWGFIKTESITLQSIPEVKAFTDDIAQTGKWNGEAVEGFVVRTTVAKPKEGAKETASSPYPPGSSFFFKVKFDEPYMMYRDWREVTRTLLSTKGPLRNAKLSGQRMKRPETRLYVKWVTEQIEKDRKQFDQFSKGKGIIRTRENFLRWLEEEKTKGSVKLAEEAQTVEVTPAESSVQRDRRGFGKTIIVPIAVPGCGKTAVSVALQHIFGFGHTQSDDVGVKKAAPVFIKNVVKLLKDHDVVIADKNNHLRQHRQALRDATAEMSPPVRLVALCWPSDKPYATIHRICCDRIVHRGDNHQSLLADAKGKGHEEIVWQFITDFQDLSSDEVDEVIEMDHASTLEQAVRTAVDGCVRILGLPEPTPEAISEALDVVNGYTVSNKNPVKFKDQRKKGQTPRYFGLLPEVNLQDLVEKAMESTPDSTEERTLWAELKRKGRVVKRPHVTITHKNAIEIEPELWERCMTLHRLNTPPVFKFNPGRIIWNDRVMAVTVENLVVDVADDEARDAAEELVSALPQDVKDRLHMTVGTRSSDIPPVEAMALVKAPETWEEASSVKLENVVLKGRISGLFS